MNKKLIARELVKLAKEIIATPARKKLEQDVFAALNSESPILARHQMAFDLLREANPLDGILVIKALRKIWTDNLNILKEIEPWITKDIGRN